MNCLIVSPFENWSTGRGNRNTLLAEQLAERGHVVQFFTTNFDHSKKQKISESQKIPDGIQVSTINVPGYKTNLSFFRLITHVLIAIKLHIFLRGKKIDCLYMSSIPPEILTIIGVRKSAVVVDIRDIWPAALNRYSANRKSWLLVAVSLYLDVFNKIFLPRADRIIIVAESYKLWLKNYTNIKPVTIPLGFREVKSIPNDLKSNYYFYAGGLTPQFDLSEFVEFVGNELIVVAGTGPLSDHYKKIFPNIHLLGSIKKEDCDKWMLGASILIFPSNKYACLPNKAFDYFASRKPILFGAKLSSDVENLFNITSGGKIQIIKDYFDDGLFGELSQMNCIKKIIEEIEGL